MSVLDTLIAFAHPWEKFYSRSKPTEAIVMFTHVGGMLWGGGLALSADRKMWKLRSASVDERGRLLVEIDQMHSAVLIGLSLSAISGVVLTAADLKTYGPSPIWWGKMVAFALLLANGAWLQRQERRLRAAPDAIGSRWTPLTIASGFSFFLWFAVTLGGVLLTSFA
jgi:hypothetical protein